MATETVENYLKALLVLAEDSPTGEATIGRISVLLGVTKGSATTMMKRLTRSKLVIAKRYGGVRLTRKGEREALDVLRRHRIIEAFLVEILKLDWADVHEEAERLEHAVSGRLLARMDEALGHPSVDPHGDPIPAAGGRARRVKGKAISEFTAGSRVRITRVMDQDPAFLRFVERHGLKPGAHVVVGGVPDEEGNVRLKRPRRGAIELSKAAAAGIMGEAAG